MNPDPSINVLLVEDNPVDVLLAKDALEDSQQFDVTVAERLSTALELLKNHRFDVVLLDLGLPDCQGLETFIKLRQGNSSIPVIVMTAKDDNELALRAVREGAQDYLVKNQVQGDTLSRSIRYAIERQRSEATINRIVRDVTERKRMEEELRDADRRKDEFLAMLSHELRNPLAAIGNAVQLLNLQENEGQVQQNARRIIERQVGQLSRLVDDLLEVSRITTGRIHLQQKRVGLNGIVEHALETVRPQMDQHKHELTVSLSPQPIWLDSDAARIEQVIVNLLTNAAKYTPDRGRISLTVRQENDEALLRVRDTGVGIAPELLPRIFDLFTQVERSLDRSEGGLGIGLCLVQRLVELHGGRVEVTSVVGQGSEFVVRLPVMKTPAIQPPSVLDVTTEPNGPSLRMLVVDDNLDAAELLGMLLKNSGHDFRMTHDGQTALEAALDYRPNVVFLDIGLPGIDGYEVASRLRQQPDLSNIVLVAITGYAEDADKLRSQESGFNHHLVKPYHFRQVKEILATVSEKAN